MKSAQASQAKQENNTIKRPGPRMTLCRKIAADCAKEGRKDRQQSSTKKKSSICDDGIVTIQKLILMTHDARETTVLPFDQFDHFERTSQSIVPQAGKCFSYGTVCSTLGKAVQNSTCSHATVFAQSHETKQD